MYLHYWFTLNFMYSVYSTFCMWYVFSHVSLHSNTSPENRCTYKSNSFPEPFPKSVDTADCNRSGHIKTLLSPEWEHMPPAEIVPLFLAWNPGLFSTFASHSTALLYWFPQYQLHLWNKQFFFHQFKRNLAILNGIEIMAYSCRKSILPRGNRNKTCFTANISLHIYHTLIHTKVTWPGYQKISNVHIALRFDTN